MSKRWLVMYEVSQKQRYIFRSNRLRENIGASTIIRWLTDEPERFFDKWNVRMPRPLYKSVGGGSALYVFESSDDAAVFVNELSLGVLKHLPGLELFLVTDAMDWEADRLYASDEAGAVGRTNVLEDMRNKLAAKKNRRAHAVRQHTWGIHRLCPDSGMPANEYTELPGTSDKVARARELNVKDEYGRMTLDDFDDRFITGLNYAPANGQRLKFMDQDYLERVLGGERSAKNYVAIVHLDGNAMGAKVGAFQRIAFSGNDDYLGQYARFTANIDQAYTGAMRKTIEHVMRNYSSWAGEIYGDSEEKLSAYSHVVPLRPVVASGDDVSFIAVGQLGIELARIFIQYLQQESMEIDGAPFVFDACAGVAIVRRKFPFWLAYELAERLCGNAKKRLKQESGLWGAAGSGDGDQSFEASLIDWEIAASGDVDLNVDQRRESIYRTGDGCLLNRPYYLFRDATDNKFIHPANYMTGFLHAFDYIQRSDMTRSKWKALRSVYHQGRTAVEQWAVQNRFETGQSLYVNVPNREGEVLAYFYDAIEVMDHMIRLGEVKAK